MRRLHAIPRANTWRLLQAAGRCLAGRASRFANRFTPSAAEIEGLRTEAGAAAQVVLRVGATTLDAKVATHCQASLGELLAIIAQAVQKIADILTAFAPLQAGFVNCTSKASSLARDVRFAALNAQVFAIHAPNGATLEVLAGRMRVISDETIQQVERLGSALQYTAELLDNLRQRLTDFHQLGQAEQHVLTAESAISRKKLVDLEGVIPELIRGISRQQGSFTECTEEVLAKVRFPVMVEAASSRSVGLFHELAAWGGETGSRLPVEQAAARKIDLFEANYTMDSERHAHAAALQPAPASVNSGASRLPLERFDGSDSFLPMPAIPSCELTVPQKPPQETPPRPVTAEMGASVAALSPTGPPAPVPSAETEALGSNVELF